MKLTVMKKDAYPRYLRTASLLLAIASLNACVTINIYFPAAAAEKAADKVIDEIWQVPAASPAPATQPSVPAATPVIPSANPVTPTVNQEPTP